MLRLLFVLSFAGCSTAPIAPARASVPPPQSAEPCVEPDESIAAGARIECVRYTDVPPLVFGPGRIRVVVKFPVPGVPAQLAEHDGFFVLDVTPTGQELVGHGTCPGHGEVELQAVDARGQSHVLCRTLEGAPAERVFLDDLRLDGDHFVRAAPPLDAPKTALFLRAFVVGGAESFVVYREGVDGPQMSGAMFALPWRAGARPVELATAVRDEISLHEEPAAILVEDGRVRLVLGWFKSGWDGSPEGYDLATLTPANVRSAGALALRTEPGERVEVPTTIARKPTVRVVLPLSDPKTEDDLVGVIERTAHLPTGPTAIASDPQLRVAYEAGHLSTREGRLACDEQACVAASVSYDSRLRVVRFAAR